MLAHWAAGMQAAAEYNRPPMNPLPVRLPGTVLRVLVAGLLCTALWASAGAQSGTTPQPVSGVLTPALETASLLEGKLPVVAEHRYRLAGKIRPLLLFWIGKDNIGSARIRWRRDTLGQTGCDLLIGSDPARAPRQTNRWGFVMEEDDGSAVSVLGVMKKSDEETLEQAKSNVASEAAGGVYFKMIRARVDASESVARVSEANVGRDYSYRELAPLMERLLAAPAPPTSRIVPVPPGGRRGMLLGLTELLHEGVETVKATSRAPGRKSLSYVFYKKQYDLTRVSSGIERSASYGGVTYPRLLTSRFEIRTRGEDWTEAFTIVCGIDAPLADVPVFIVYQPRWWLKVEMVLDERQPF